MSKYLQNAAFKSRKSNYLSNVWGRDEFKANQANFKYFHGKNREDLIP